MLDCIGVLILTSLTGYCVTLRKALTGEIFCALVSPLKGQEGHICCSSFHRSLELIDIMGEII